MKIVRSVKTMVKLSKEAHLLRQAIGFVPTMGALHAGHISLIREARRENDKVVVSIFVNPIQFGPREDYRRYPRNLTLDARLCRREGVDILFFPGREEMYPANYKTYVVCEGLSDALCGRFRRGHFRGVATVVAKLLNIVGADIAYFGQKDAQQSLIIKKMVKDLNIPVKIKVMPTIRQKDGLALSSRNAYLSQKERDAAQVLYQSLSLARGLIREGNTSSADIIGKMRGLINKQRCVSVEYISIVDPQELRLADKIKDEVLIALAVWIGKTRLIDNMIVRC